MRSWPGALAVLTLLTAAAHGLEPGAQYEEQLIDWALAESRLERDLQPAGKIIERVEIVREEVIARTDPWPGFLNYLHVTSRDAVVRQELLIGPGEPWDEARVEESARNLRGLSTLAAVRTVACRGSGPDRVVLLVVTKDLWSIRLNSQLSMVGQVVQALDLLPAEQNLLGLGKAVSLHLRLQQFDAGALALRDKAAIGEVYVDPRLFGTRLRLQQSFDLLLAGAVPCGGRASDGSQWCPSHRAGQIDGAQASLDLQRPLFSLATDWAFDLAGSVNVRQVRLFVYNAGPASPGHPAGLGLDTTTFDDASVPAEQRVYLPRVYDVSNLASQASVTRSFGIEDKHDLGGGFGAYRLRYTPPADFPFDEATRQQYAGSSLPGSEDAAYAFLSYRDRDTRYLRLHDIQAFALTEDFLLGHDLSLTVRAAANLTQRRQGFADASMRARYLWYAADDLLWVWLDAQARWQPHLDEIGRRGPWADEALEIGAKNVSPHVWGGRFHLQVRLLLRSNDLGQTTSALGGDTGLRGYPSNAFVGANLFQVNAEYRTGPLNLHSLHLGLVGFYDGGAVFGGPDPRSPAQELAFQYHQGLGVGLRAQFPQFDKQALRADFGVPLGAGGSLATWFSLSFQQVL